MNRRDADNISEISDSDLDFGFDSKFQPKEVIFAELSNGSYFGELNIMPAHL